MLDNWVDEISGLAPLQIFLVTNLGSINLTQEQQPQPDQTRAEQTSKIITVVVGLAVIAGVWFNYESGKPLQGSYQADCYRFSGYMDEKCTLDYAVQALGGHGRVHSQEYLERHK
jgi:hypothetical protein